MKIKVGSGNKEMHVVLFLEFLLALTAELAASSVILSLILVV